MFPIGAVQSNQSILLLPLNLSCRCRCKRRTSVVNCQ